MPLFLRYPDGFDPIMIEECVSLVDILPTILDIAGIEDGERRDGISLRPRLRGEADRLPRPGVRAEYKEEPDRIRYKAWITPEWKLAVYSDEAWGELYDLTNDPHEWDNRFDDPDLAPVRERLLREILEDMERSEPLGSRNSRV